jgi:hypothetical protein
MLIVELFVGQILKIEFKPIPYLYNRKKRTGWDLNPRPQYRSSLKMLFTSAKGTAMKENRIVQLPLSTR